MKKRKKKKAKKILKLESFKMCFCQSLESSHSSSLDINLRIHLISNLERSLDTGIGNSLTSNFYDILEEKRKMDKKR